MNCNALVRTFKHLEPDQVGLGVRSWPRNLTNTGSTLSEFDYTS